MFNLKSISFERMKKPPSGREKEVRNMSAEEFFQNLKRHCAETYDKHSCKECRFLELCYCPPKDYPDELRSASIAYFS